VYLKLEKTHLIATNLSFLTFLWQIFSHIHINCANFFHSLGGRARPWPPSGYAYVNTTGKITISHLYYRAPVQSRIEDAIREMAEKIIRNKIKVQSMNTGKETHSSIAIISSITATYCCFLKLLFSLFLNML